MYLKEIKAYGFKSFADKISIELGENLNGIVGPNGSGKSNIVDAVRWVLGEQSIKSLRGENAADIIFSGSKSRKALNSATVTLIFNNTDRKIPLDFNEISIKRTLYRTGENEYFINNERVRLKDITELLIDTGGSKESFNIISQGKIDEIVLAKPSERRIIIEEAAGVLKYKKRKEEAIRKLEKTNLNLNRVNDIIDELELNLAPLEQQSKAAKEYLEIKDKLKNIEVALITKDIENLNFEYKDIKEKITNLTDEIAFNSKNTTTYDIDIIKEKNKAKLIEEEINQKQTNYIELTKKLEQKDADYRLLKERRKFSDEIDKINNKILELKEKKLSYKSNLDKEENELELLQEKIDVINIDINKNKEEYQNLKTKRDIIKTNLAKNERDIINLKYKIDYLENTINNNATMPNSIKSILNNKKINGVHNIVGKLIDIKQDYILAINTSLMASTNYLIVDTTTIAKTLVKYLKENNLGRTTFYPLDVIKPRLIDNTILDKISKIEGFIDIAANLVTYNNIYDNVIKNLLGNVIIANNIDSANIISKQINNSYKIVTLDGQVINVGGSITGGSAIKTTSVIKEKYELETNVKLKEKLLKESEELEYNLKLIDNKITKLEDIIYNKRSEIANLNNNKDIKYQNKVIKQKEYDNTCQELSDLEAITNTNSNLYEQQLMDEYYQIKKSVQLVEKELEKLKINKNNVEENISEIEQLNKQSNTYINKLEKELNTLEIKANRIDVRLDTLLLNLTEEYSITFEYAKENYILELEEDIARIQVKSLKERLKNIGAVNLGAIEEYDRVNERYTFLDNQRSDLKNAEDTLLEIIKEMDEVMIEKFSTTFNQIQQEFSNVFKALFKGGKAEIILTDPNNLLSTGVEIKAEPPGKHLQSISLLSGGEKTFTAISLLFAILNVRPVPFCILDEVEAALDDANVEAFCKYLAKYKNETQFILITHKKKTMEYIDLLYGITMQESGVSKLVSVKLEDIKNNY